MISPYDYLKKKRNNLAMARMKPDAVARQMYAKDQQQQAQVPQDDYYNKLERMQYRGAPRVPEVKPASPFSEPFRFPMQTYIARMQEIQPQVQVPQEDEQSRLRRLMMMLQSRGTY